MALPDYEKLGVFYLGRKYDPATKKPTGELILYPSKNLVTHGLVVGMTGSGKTGLCFDIIEEAAIDSIPAILIDPKGDLSNLLLTFPDLKPDEFKPWINADDAAKAGISVDDFAQQQAELWKNGLATWGQDADRIRRLRDAADFAIYTPGSSAGLQVSVLSSFARPPAEILEDSELLRDRVGTTVAGLLQLVGVDADPVKSREAVLLSNLLQTAWTKGRDLDLSELIQEVQKPSIKKIGVLDVDSFFPAKHRFELAMQLNNLLASPGFSAWMEGEPLDVGQLLHTKAGKPRIAIFSIAHLGDSERMFFVTMLLNQVLAWMRSQSGTNSLRALLYMDEIFGYFPPVANPPSKLPLLTLLKQARAFGLGVVLATQNPVDLDYKGLANIGTWFIGRLQTDRDKARVLDGLEGAALGHGGKFDRAAMEKTLASLANRVFLLHSVHDDEHVLFQSRWAMSYLRGPMSRSQIKSIMADGKDPDAKPVMAEPKTAPPLATRVTSTRPVLPPEVPQVFAPPRGKPPAGGGLLYQPRVLGAATVRFTDKKAKIDTSTEVIVATEITDEAVAVNWEQAEELSLALDDLTKEAPEAEFADVPPAAGQVKSFAKWTKDLAAWVYGSRRLTIFRSPSTDEISKPDEDERAFRIRIQQRARELRDEEIDGLRKKLATKLAAQEDRVRRAQAAQEREESQARTSKLSTVFSVGSTILNGIFGSKRVLTATNINKATSAMKSASRTIQQSDDVSRALGNVEAEKAKLDELNAALKAEMDALTVKYEVAGEKLESVELKPTKTNITIKLVSLVWLPYFRDAVGALTKGY
ncbi:MAG: ATP-binding protein [Gemmataceae bacterium]